MRETSKGFTLIELLIVITILGVLATVVIAALNPLRKINLANDAKIKSDVSAIAKAAQISTTNTGGYAKDQAGLLSGGDLGTTWPTGPATVTYNVRSAPATCTTLAGDCTSFAVYASKLFAPVTTGNTWCWRSSAGMAAESTVAGCTAP